MASQSMISVVIPLYNKRDSIASTVESVLSQSYQDFELIIVDDGSTDGSADVVGQFDDSRIHLISKKNGGVSSARNEGIRHANSNWIAFLDGDDLWEKGFLTEVDRMINEFPHAGIVGTSYSFLKNGIKVPANKPFHEEFYGIVDNSNWDKAHMFCSTAVCCRKDALEHIGLFDERIAYGEDTDVWWRIMLEYTAVFSNKELAVYRFDENNRAMNRKIPLSKLYINYFEKYSEARKKNPAFRHFIDKECMWWLYDYCLESKEDVRRILSYIDMKEYKFSFRFRFKFPRLYKVFKRV